MENAANPALKVEVLKPLPTGTLVRLPDGDEGVINWSSHAEVHVVHPGRILGRGPWIFARHQVEPLTASDVPAYLERNGGGLAAYRPDGLTIVLGRRAA
jgi:hypothetical protein